MGEVAAAGVSEALPMAPARLPAIQPLRSRPCLLSLGTWRHVVAILCTVLQLNIGVLVVSLCAASIAGAQPSLFCCPALAQGVAGGAGALAALAAWQYFTAKKK